MRRDVVGMAPQVDLDTPETTMSDFIPVATMTRESQRQILEMDETLGTRAPSSIEYGSGFHQFALGLAPRPSSLGRILTGFHGLPTTVAGTAGDAGSYVHTWDDPDAECVPHSVLRSLNDPSPAIVDLFTGAKGNDYELTSAVDDYLRMAANYVAKGRDGSQPAVTNPALDVSKRWNFKQITVYVNLNGAGEVAIPCHDASYAESNQLDTDDLVLGSDTLFSLEEGNLTGTMKFTPRINLRSFYEEALKADPTTSTARIVATGKVIAATTKHFSFETKAYCIQFTANAADADASQKLRGVGMEARCYLDDTTGKFVDKILTNATASYA